MSTKLIQVISPRTFASGGTIDNYITGKKYVIFLSIDYDGANCINEDFQVFFVGNMSRSILTNVICGNGRLIKIGIKISETGAVSLLNTWDETNSTFIDYSDRYFSVYEII